MRSMAVREAVRASLESTHLSAIRPAKMGHRFCGWLDVGHPPYPSS